MIRGWLAELYRRDRILTIAGWVMIGLFVAMLFVAPFDHRQVRGLNPYIKPMKFTLSVAAYLWSVAWFMGYLSRPRWLLAGLRWAIAIVMILEIGLIILQAVRGTTSHYNCSTAFDCRVFNWMGMMIALNSVFIAVLFVVLLQPLPALAPAYRWGIRIGVLVLLLGSGEGTVMITNMAHTVGAPDGGPGLPLLNWSTSAGDLRIAHLLALHGLQLIPLAGWMISRLSKTASPARQVAAVVAFSILYVAVTFVLYRQALSGHPFLSL